MNVINEIQRINEIELTRGLVNTSASWHAKYSKSAWCYTGNLPLELSEGDVICFMSQFGEIEDIHLVRDSDTGKSKGFAFVKYEDARSCILAVDNFCGMKIMNRSIRIDHVEKYRLPKHLQKKEDEGDEENNDDDIDEVKPSGPGHAYQGQELASEYSISKGQDLFGIDIPKKKELDVDDHDERYHRKKRKHKHSRRKEESSSYTKEKKKRKKHHRRGDDRKSDRKHRKEKR